jgi:hypothetical protein
MYCVQRLSTTLFMLLWYAPFDSCLHRLVPQAPTDSDASAQTDVATGSVAWLSALSAQVQAHICQLNSQHHLLHHDESMNNCMCTSAAAQADNYLTQLGTDAQIVTPGIYITVPPDEDAEMEQQSAAIACAAPATAPGPGGCCSYHMR